MSSCLYLNLLFCDTQHEKAAKGKASTWRFNGKWNFRAPQDVFICLQILFYLSVENCVHFFSPAFFPVCANWNLDFFWPLQHLKCTNPKWNSGSTEALGCFAVTFIMAKALHVIQRVNTELSQPLSSFNQNRSDALIHRFFSLDIQGLQLNVGHSLSSFASLNLSRSEDWKQRMWWKKRVWNETLELLFSLLPV